MDEATGAPHEAMFLVLAYLPLHELLSMGQVCKSLRDAIRHDVLVWLDLVVESPLNLRLTDQILMRLASKAQGRLRTLALLNCVNITDYGLLSVVNENPLITKLYVPACTGLTPEGIVKVVKQLVDRHRSRTTSIMPSTRLKLKISGIYNINQEHLLELESHLHNNTTYQRKLRFYHKYKVSTFRNLDDDEEEYHPIDVEICPKCKDVKLVFDCPRETCMATRRGRQKKACRGCIHCAVRCEGCGKCMEDENDDDEVGETICNDTLCLDCWLCLPKCAYCNKPFCPKHANNQQHMHPSGSGGFICEACWHIESLKYT